MLRQSATPSSLKYLCEFGSGSSCRYSRRYPPNYSKRRLRPSRFIFRGFLDNLPVCIEHSLCESMCVNEALGLERLSGLSRRGAARVRAGALVSRAPVPCASPSPQHLCARSQPAACRLASHTTHTL